MTAFVFQGRHKSQLFMHFRLQLGWVHLKLRKLPAAIVCWAVFEAGATTVSGPPLGKLSVCNPGFSVPMQSMMVRLMAAHLALYTAIGLEDVG